ncbi:class I SAM-dependent methyltransferase [Aliikangiella sp. IMCC44632]
MNNPSATFEVMDARNIDQIRTKFDAVVCGFCTPYLSKQDVEKLFKDVGRILQPKGIFYVSSMEDDDSRTGFQSSTSGDSVYTYYHQFKHFKKHLELNQFKVIKVSRKAFPDVSQEPTSDMFLYASAY